MLIVSTVKDMTVVALRLLALCWFSDHRCLLHTCCQRVVSHSSFRHRLPVKTVNNSKSHLNHYLLSHSFIVLWFPASFYNAKLCWTLSTPFLFVCLSVRPSVTRRYWVKNNEHRMMPSSLSGRPVSIWQYKLHQHIRKRSHLARVLNET